MAKAWKPAAELPLLGVARHIVLAENDNEAKHAAQRAYRPWRKHLELLWKQHGVPFRLTMFPLEFDELQDAGGAFAGTAGGARTYIERQMEMSGANYFVCDISFGDLTLAEATQTVQLLVREVLPAFADRAGAEALGRTCTQRALAHSGGPMAMESAGASRTWDSRLAVAKSPSQHKKPNAQDVLLEEVCWPLPPAPYLDCDRLMSGIKRGRSCLAIQ